MNATTRTQTTGKADVRRDTTGRILAVSARLEAMRLLVNRRLNGNGDLLRTIAQAELQVAAQRRIAQRDRSTIPALQAAAAEAERVVEAAYAEVQAAKEAAARPVEQLAAPVRTRAPRGQYTERSTPIFERDGVQVRMVTYPTYRYDVVGGGEPLRMPATRRWRTERAAALAEAERRIGTTA